MYRINKKANTVTKLESKLFKDLEIREREHLQEWIAHKPEMLGEDLLIIQKEFDGFDETNERLDLLAVDKEGNLVIIENKLDDTGKNVAWQALKYTAYCSTLTTEQILTIFQKYLDENGIGGDAKEILLEFFGTEKDELLLNTGDQRIIFVANNYRKEVTSTVIWLLDHNVQIQCFRAQPYSYEDEHFLQIDQIIPVPETAEFMIKMREKEQEEKSKSEKVKDTEGKLIRFWSLLKEKLKSNGFIHYDSIGAKPYWYLSFSKGNGSFGICIGRKSYRVELYFPNDADKHLIDAMLHRREEIEKSFGKPITFERLEGKKASRIRFDLEYEKITGSFDDEDTWSSQINWMVETMPKFYEAVFPVWEEVQKEL